MKSRSRTNTSKKLLAPSLKVSNRTFSSTVLLILKRARLISLKNKLSLLLLILAESLLVSPTIAVPMPSRTKWTLNVLNCARAVGRTALWVLSRQPARQCFNHNLLWIYDLCFLNQKLKTYFLNYPLIWNLLILNLAWTKKKKVCMKMFLFKVCYHSACPCPNCLLPPSRKLSE